MKNTLAENMLRFGVKNLQESDLKKISESLLTEDTDLMPKLGKDFTTNMIVALKKHPKTVRFYFGSGQYYAVGRQDLTAEWADAKPNYYYVQSTLTGGFSTLTTISVIGVGEVPIIPDPATSGVGQWQWNGKSAELLQLIAAPGERQLGLDSLASYQGNVGSAIYTQLYAASTIKPRIDQAVATLKAKPVEIRSKLPYAIRTAFGISDK